MTDVCEGGLKTRLWTLGCGVSAGNASLSSFGTTYIMTEQLVPHLQLVWIDGLPHLYHLVIYPTSSLPLYIRLEMIGRLHHDSCPLHSSRHIYLEMKCI